MADITCTSTGKTFWRIDDGVAALLLEALPSVFERHNPRPQPTPQELVPWWGIGVHHITGAVFIQFKLGTIRDEKYFGHPKRLTNSTFGWPVPEAVSKEYERRWQPTNLTESEGRQLREYNSVARGKGDK